MYQNFIFDLYGTLINIKTDETSGIFWDKVADFFKKNNAEYSGKSLFLEYRRIVKLKLEHISKIKKIKKRNSNFTI